MNKKQQIKKQIQQKELQIKKLALHLDSSDVCSELYNTLILEKAVLKKELSDLGSKHIIENIKKLFRKEKLICDYFKE